MGVVAVCSENLRGHVQDMIFVYKPWGFQKWRSVGSHCGSADLGRRVRAGDQSLH